MKKITAYLFSMIVVFSTLILSSCSSTIKLPQVPVEERYGVKIVTIAENEVKGYITYYGDYWFHDFNKNLYPAVSKSYLKALSKENRGDNSKMLWANHTTALPYFSSVALIYNEKKDIEKFEDKISKSLKKKYNGTMFEGANFNTKSGNFRRLSYLIYDEKTKTQTQHIEYFGVVKDKTLRIIFWTSDSNLIALNNETDNIMHTLSIEWY
jgi:hypothetical protein